MTAERTDPATATTVATGAHRVVVVVVSFNSAELLPGLVASLPAGLDGVAWQLVVADNASGDDSVAVVRAAAPEAVVVETGSNVGYAAGINRAVAAAGPHTAVLVLNADVRLQPGCVRELLAVLERPGIGIVVPRLVDGHGRLIASMRREPTLRRALAEALVGNERAGHHPSWGEMVMDPACYETQRDTDWAEGSTQLISAECWRACGSWDESFFLYSEETDFDLRARDAGYRTRFVPTARAVHLEGDSAGSPRLWPLLVVNRVRLYRRRHGLVRTVAFWAAVVVREGTRAALGRETSRAAVRALLNPRRMRQPAGASWLR